MKSSTIICNNLFPLGDAKSIPLSNATPGSPQFSKTTGCRHENSRKNDKEYFLVHAGRF